MCILTYLKQQTSAPSQLGHESYVHFVHDFLDMFPPSSKPRDMMGRHAFSHSLMCTAGRISSACRGLMVFDARKDTRDGATSEGSQLQSMTAC